MSSKYAYAIGSIRSVYILIGDTLNKLKFIFFKEIYLPYMCYFLLVNMRLPFNTVLSRTISDILKMSIVKMIIERVLLFRFSIKVTCALKT